MLELKLEQIDKWYAKPGKKNAVHALKDVTLTLREGIYGLTGSNGAGKSTLLQILTGYLLPDGGALFLNGKKVSAREKHYKSKIGFMPQQASVYDSMTCIQFLDYMAALKGISRPAQEVEAGLRDVHLWEHRKKRVSELSGGMRQRLMFSQSCLGSPFLLLLDEPTAGLDPEERENLKNLVRRHSGGKIVIIATHILSDLEDLATGYIKMKQGEAVLQDCFLKEKDN